MTVKAVPMIARAIMISRRVKPKDELYVFLHSAHSPLFLVLSFNKIAFPDFCPAVYVIKHYCILTVIFYEMQSDRFFRTHGAKLIGNLSDRDFSERGNNNVFESDIINWEI